MTPIITIKKKLSSIFFIETKLHYFIIKYFSIIILSLLILMLKKWRFGECGVKKAGFFISQFKLHQLTHTTHSDTVTPPTPPHPTTSLYISENELCWISILAFFSSLAAPFFQVKYMLMVAWSNAFAAFA